MKSGEPDSYYKLVSIGHFVPPKLGHKKYMFLLKQSAPLLALEMEATEAPVAMALEDAKIDSDSDEVLEASVEQAPLQVEILPLPPSPTTPTSPIAKSTSASSSAASNSPRESIDEFQNVEGVQVPLKLDGGKLRYEGAMERFGYNRFVLHCANPNHVKCTGSRSTSDVLNPNWGIIEAVPYVAVWHRLGHGLPDKAAHKSRAVKVSAAAQEAWLRENGYI